MDKTKKFEMTIAGVKDDDDLQFLGSKLGAPLICFMRQNNIDSGTVTLEGPEVAEHPLLGNNAYMVVWLQYCQE